MVHTINSIEEIFSVLIKGQQEKLLAFAHEFNPHLSLDDLLQPNDYPELENHPYFRYLEGVLQGIQGAQMALKANQEKHI
jgi:hypothetical protein